MNIETDIDMDINKKINTPWVDKYKPTNLDNVILTDKNRQILSNIISTHNFPNVLFYGPPGTGKTTTIINLVKKYHETLKQKHKALTIHLNASDDRGIEIVRTQIHQFVYTKQLFFPGMKFVILDEVDYMTDVAQQALQHLIQSSVDKNVRFCLICNYIGKINEKLQNNFIKIRFNQLPIPDMIQFLTKISTSENLTISETVMMNIQRQFQSDVRSMINMLQTYQNYSLSGLVVLDTNVYKTLYKQIMTCDKLTKKDVNKFIGQIKTLEKKANVSQMSLLKQLIYVVIWNERDNPKCSEFMNFAETMVHNKNTKYAIYLTIIQIHRLSN